MKKFIKFVFAVAIIAVIAVAAVIIVPKYLHTCDACDSVVLGKGYEPGLLSDVLEEEKYEIVCKECAEEQHKVEIALGKTVEDFKK